MTQPRMLWRNKDCITWRLSLRLAILLGVSTTVEGHCHYLRRWVDESPEISSEVGR